MASLLGQIEEAYEIYHEIDHIVELTAQIWTHRASEPSSRERHLRSSRAFEDNYAPVEGFGPIGTYAGVHVSYSQIVPEVVRVTVGLVNDGLGVNTPMEFSVPLYILHQSSFFEEHLKADKGHPQIGTIDRPSSLFPLVIVLLKIRWVLKLHTTLAGCDVRRVSLRRFLMGLLAVATDAKASKTVERTLDLLMDKMRTKIGTYWPKFVEWVGLHDSAPDSEHLQRSGLIGSPSALPCSNAFLWQLGDDIFVAHLAQQDLAVAPAEAVMQEFDFYGITRPLVSLDLKGLLSWVSAAPASRFRFQKAAQRQAHHLCLALELSDDVTMQELTDEEISEAVNHIVGYPKTFNSGLQHRFRSVFPQRVGHMVENGQLEKSTMDNFFAFGAHSRDVGRLQNRHIETMRDKGMPWLWGNQEVKFRKAADVWPKPLPKESKFPFDTGPLVPQKLIAK